MDSRFRGNDKNGINQTFPNLIRMLIVAAPWVACVVVATYIWRSSDVNQSGYVNSETAPLSSAVNDPVPEVAAGRRTLSDVVDKPSMTPEQNAPAQPVITMEQEETTWQESDDTTQEDVSSAEILMPVPVYNQEALVPIEERLADVTRRAISGVNHREREEALLELAMIGGLSALDILSEALDDVEPQVRLAAVTSARQLAQNKGDEGGAIKEWLVQAGYNADEQVAAWARESANELAEIQGEERPFP